MSDAAESVRSAYDTWANIYDTEENPLRDLNVQALREQERLRLEGASVLELGCGTGLNTVWLAASARRVIAVDFSDGMLERARRRISSLGPQYRIKFQRADITRRWPFEDGEFDIVVANLVLEHVEDLDHVFSEVGRVTEAQAQLYIAELHPYRQLIGKQARFSDPATGNELRVPAFPHTISQFVNGARGVGFTLDHMDERKVEADQFPRLVTLLFEST